MDPGKPLAAVAYWTSQAHSESGNHFFHGSAAFSKHHSQAGGEHPVSSGPGLEGFGFPVPADPGQEITACRLGFGEHIVFSAPVITGG